VPQKTVRVQSAVKPDAMIAPNALKPLPKPTAGKPAPPRQPPPGKPTTPKR